jgi:hypothetical protein
VENPSFAQSALGLWTDYDAMMALYHQHFSQSGAIALCLSLEESAPTPEWGPLLTPEAGQGIEIPSNFHSLGYDVANIDLISSISNRGFRSEEMDAARLRWRGKINEYGVFDTLTDARAYRAQSNLMMGDSPFFIFELKCSPVPSPLKFTDRSGASSPTTPGEQVQ